MPENNCPKDLKQRSPKFYVVKSLKYIIRKYIVMTKILNHVD